MKNSKLLLIIASPFIFIIACVLATADLLGVFKKDKDEEPQYYD